jgi:hypothetical protein
MARQLLSILVLLVLGLQGVVQASNAVVVTQAMHEHCADHDALSEPCECCPEGLASTLGCSTLCSMIAAIPALSVPTQTVTQHERHSLIVSEFVGPTYLPLKPPPISPG